MATVEVQINKVNWRNCQIGSLEQLLSCRPALSATLFVFLFVVLPCLLRRNRKILLLFPLDWRHSVGETNNLVKPKLQISVWRSRCVLVRKKSSKQRHDVATAQHVSPHPPPFTDFLFILFMFSPRSYIAICLQLHIAAVGKRLRCRPVQECSRLGVKQTASWRFLNKYTFPEKGSTCSLITN